MKKWLVASDKHFNVSDDHVYEKIISELLSNRGLTGKKNIAKFLHPDLKEINFREAGIDESELSKAAERVKKAIKNKEQMVVYTDYDVDGITSGAIIWETINDLGGKIMPFVPHRVTEGYGLSETGIDRVIEKFDPRLIITVDHGITAAEQISYAKKKSIDVVVIDHHLAPEKLPKAVSVVHSTKMAAGGVALLFAVYLYEKLRGQKEADKKFLSFLDLAALATIADLVPLAGMNRVLVKYGLVSLQNTKRVGLEALIASAGLDKSKIDVYSVSHMLAPRLNSTGRILHGLDSLRLICTRDRQRAVELAEKISMINRDRQLMTDDNTARARELLRVEEVKGKMGKLIFIASDYNQGIIGLIAGKLVDLYQRPAIVVSVGAEFCKASARSVAGFNIVGLLRQATDLLVDVGGHPMAAGFTVRKDKLEILKKTLQGLTEKTLTDGLLVGTLAVDLILDLTLANLKLLQAQEDLAPFGMGNPQPVYASYGTVLAGYSRVGRDQKHLKFILKGGAAYLEAIAFNFGDLATQLSPGVKLDVAYTLNRDGWKGKDNLILKIKDVRVSANL